MTTPSSRSLAFFVVCVLVPAISGQASAEVKLDGLFSYNAVLQRGVPVAIFGTADEGDRVTVHFQNHTAEGIVKDGRWRAELPPLEAGGPYTLEITGSRHLSVQHLYVGEVWVCAGQSNMQWTVYHAKGSGSAMLSPDNRQLHFYTVTREPAAEPKHSNEAIWSTGASATVSNFSAVGYYFGRELAKLTDVPIGLINCSHYQSATESWVAKATLEADKDLKPIVDDVLPDRKDVLVPGSLYNGMVLPISQYAIRGVICYQGENAAERADVYAKLFAAQIADWRKAWNNPKLPFLFVQIAPAKPSVASMSENKLALIREAQAQVAADTPDTAMVVTTDYGDAYSLHPREKEPVGARLALAAQAVAYDKDVAYQGPTYKSHSAKKNQVIVEFDHVGDGLEMKGSKLLGFTVAGTDGQFVPATATIAGDKVVVTAEKVPNPKHVRYAWADFPVCNLFNKAGLPAVPFRSDKPDAAKKKSLFSVQ